MFDAAGGYHPRRKESVVNAEWGNYFDKRDGTWAKN